MWEIKCFKGCIAVDSEEKKMNGGEECSYTHNLTTKYIQPLNELRGEIIQ